MRHTPLNACHVAAGARMTPFAGFAMPLHYGSQLDEHHAVRSDAGMFDVSHMAIIDIEGPAALALLHRVFANDAAKAVPGRAVYGVLLNEAAGVIDDVIVYGRPNGYRLVANASRREVVLSWLARHAASFDVAVREAEQLAMVAVQGPTALGKWHSATGIDAAGLPPFGALEQGAWLVARTGYTGEDGVEVMLPGTEAPAFWEALTEAGVAPCGLAARDTLRLEAGLNLYGQDMDEATTPLEANLGWTVAWQPADRQFIGRAALAAQRRERPAQRLNGVVMEAKGVLRHGYSVRTDAGDGIITSGIFSPTLGFSVALARLPQAAAGACRIEIRGRERPGRIVKPPFVRFGAQVFE